MMERESVKEPPGGAGARVVLAVVMVGIVVMVGEEEVRDVVSEVLLLELVGAAGWAPGLGFMPGLATPGLMGRSAGATAGLASGFEAGLAGVLGFTTASGSAGAAACLRLKGDDVSCFSK